MSIVKSFKFKKIISLYFYICFFIFLNSKNSLSTQVYFLFLHGMPEKPNILTPLKEKLEERFNKVNITFNFLYPHLPDSESIDTWAENVAKVIKKWDKAKNIVIIGLSMGGKVAVHLTANKKYEVQHKIDTVITINSPLLPLKNFRNKFFGKYYPSFVLPFISSYVLGYEKPDGLRDVIYFDSSKEVKWIKENKHFLAFVSGNNNPKNKGNDYFPWCSDDGIVPLSAQYVEGTPAIYYGEKEHEAVFLDPEVTEIIAQAIFDYLSGNPIISFEKFKSGFVRFKRKGLFSPSSQKVIIKLPLPEGRKRSHFEIKILSDNYPFLLHQANVKCKWANRKDEKDASLIIEVSNLLPFEEVFIRWTVFQKKLIIRNKPFIGVNL